MVTASSILDRVLVLEMVRVTEAAAIAASHLIGRGDEKAADAAAVEAMRAALNELPMDGTVVIGEGERDEAPMLFIGSMIAISVAFAIFLIETQVGSRAVRVRSDLLQHRAVDESGSGPYRGRSAKEPANK